MILVLLEAYPVVVTAGIVYVISGYAMALRVGWLKSSGRMLDAPAATQLLFGNMGTAFFTFAFSGRHRAFKDQFTSAMVWVFRIATVIAPIAFAARVIDPRLRI